MITVQPQQDKCTSPRTLIGKRNIGMLSQEEYDIITLQLARERWRECRRRWEASHHMNRPDLFWAGDVA